MSEEASREQIADAMLEGDAFDILDLLEEDPARRVVQVQQVRIHLLKTNPNGLDKEQVKVLDQLSKTDISLMRMDVDKDSSQSMRELADAVGNILAKQTTAPYRVFEGECTKSSAPQLEMEELGDGVVKEEYLSTELGSPEYDAVMAVTLGASG